MSFTDDTRVAELLHRVRRITDALGMANCPEGGVMLEIDRETADAVLRNWRHSGILFPAPPVRSQEPVPVLKAPVRGEVWTVLYGVRLLWLGR